MRWHRLILAAVALSLVGASGQGAITRTAPRATATATARWWHQTVRIVYASGAWEYGYRRWYGLADAPVSPTIWVGGTPWQQQSAWMLVGARIEVVGQPYPGF